MKPHLASGVGTGVNTYSDYKDEALVRKANQEALGGKMTLETAPHPGSWFTALGEGLISLINNARLQPVTYGLGCLALLVLAIAGSSLFLIFSIFRR